MMRKAAAPPLIMFRRLEYHAVDWTGACACDPARALNMDHAQEWDTVPPGLRCQRPECVWQQEMEP